MTVRTNPAPHRRRATGRGVLVVIAFLLLGSAALRLGNGAGQALARAAGADPVESGAAQATPGACLAEGDLQPLLNALQKREAQLETREAAFEDRMKALRVADREVGRKLAALETAETRLRGTIALAETASEDDLARLTRVYETMKPKQAAALFEKMDPNFAAGFLGRMRPDAAAKIMTGLSPEAAHLFSVVLAGRNANVPDR